MTSLRPYSPKNPFYVWLSLDSLVGLQQLSNYFIYYLNGFNYNQR